MPSFDSPDFTNDCTAIVLVTLKLPLAPFTDEELALIEVRVRESGLREILQRS